MAIYYVISYLDGLFYIFRDGLLLDDHDDWHNIDAEVSDSGVLDTNSANIIDRYFDDKVM